MSELLVAERSTGWEWLEVDLPKRRTSKQLGALFFGSCLATALDEGTRLSWRVDLTECLTNTSLISCRSEEFPKPPAPPSSMAQIAAIAPLSLRRWATVFGVSQTAIRNWLTSNPNSTERLAHLNEILSLVREAARRRRDVSRWLVERLPDSDFTPADLLAEGRTRAFLGAMRMSGPQPKPQEHDLLEARRDRLPWAIPEYEQPSENR